MGVLDKIKNALFEVEYVEEEDKPKKEKKFKHKDVSNENDEDKPIAKKIVLPGKKEEKVEEIEEEELKDEDFEIRPKDEVVKEVFSDNFNIMDDYAPPVTEPEEVVNVEPVVPETEPPVATAAQVQSPVGPVYQEALYANKDYVREYDSYKEKVYNTIHDDYRIKTRESRPYGMDPSYQVSIKEYGTENKDDKGYFKPSPIISPIYGILDKNYRKEDVVSKREIHTPSSYVKTNMNVDDIRAKAYGRRSSEDVEVEEVVPEKKPIESVFEVDNSEDENLLVDLTDEKKPEVKEITVGDAMEYYHDLGLEYNVDYVDASNKNAPKPKSDDLEEDIKDTIDQSTEEEVVEEPVIERTMEIPQEVTTPETVPETTPETTPVEEEKKEEPVVEEKVEEEKLEEETKEATLDDDDNLFDLIDSMYKDEDN